MLAFVGILVGESGFNFLGSKITGIICAPQARCLHKLSPLENNNLIREWVYVPCVDSSIGPAIYQYQQAHALYSAFTPIVLGLCLVIEGYSIVNDWKWAKGARSASDGRSVGDG